ncbi:hypothetical protein BJ878DRAFT_497854 [Calycina marina]|uniref:Sulfotransferase n=1 Tax=Calycina marina TaxID=1763456 RepID=A0A9P8CGW1_9HELO|nr:hypothetical protein BJ878DRAFT_497854 [Calycina marina]
MPNKPIFVATHPRACSTAFERVFMTRTDDLQCVHEPFGDAFYFGPERLGERYEDDEQTRVESGFAESTYKTVFDRLEREGENGKRLFIKDITHYLLPPNGKPASIAPSLGGEPDSSIIKSTSSPPYPYATHPEPANPTVVPLHLLRKFHFTFLIRHPRHSIPSYYRCTIPPLAEVTGFHDFMPAEAGYDELRRLFEYLKAVGEVGPGIAGRKGDEQMNGVGENGKASAGKDEVSITVIDADDLLDHPTKLIETYCAEVGLEYKPEMLIWDTEAAHAHAREAFEKWKGFHDDAINSTSLKQRSADHKKKSKTIEEENAEWARKYGEKGAKTIRESVDANLEDYEYLKGFAVKIKAF